MKYLLIFFSAIVFAQEFELEKPKDSILFINDIEWHFSNQAITYDKNGMYRVKFYSRADGKGGTIEIKCRLEEVEPFKDL